MFFCVFLRQINRGNVDASCFYKKNYYLIKINMKTCPLFRCQLLVALVFMMLFAVKVSAQSAVVPAGGTLTGNGGTVTYTVGQPADMHLEGSNAKLNEGVQQPYEFYTIGIDDHANISLDAKVFPNPTLNYVQLSLINYEIPANGLSAMLYDANGKLLQIIKVSSMQTRIEMSSYPSAIYQLRVMEGKHLLKTFKIVKNNF